MIAAQNVEPSSQTQMPGSQPSAPRPETCDPLFPENSTLLLCERDANARLPASTLRHGAAPSPCSRCCEQSPLPRERGCQLPLPRCAACAATHGTCCCSPRTRDSTPELAVEDDPECVAARSESVGPKLFPMFRPKAERKVCLSRCTQHVHGTSSEFSSAK